MLWLGWMARCAAQSPSYTNYLAAEGLASATVYGCLQDHEGYLWFWTESGASRFDGTSFQNYTVQNGLSGNDVLSMFEDSKGRIWFLPFNERVSYYEKGSIHKSQTDPWLSAIKGDNFIAGFIEDRNGVLWLVDDADNVYRIYPDNRVELDRPRDASLIRRFRALYLNEAGTPMAFNNVGLRDLTQQTWVHHVRDSLNRWSTIRIAEIGPDSHLCALGSRLVLIHGDQVQPLQVAQELFETEALSLSRDQHGALWFGTRNGAVKVTQFRIVGSTFVVQQMTRYLPGTAITGVMTDHEGNYWMTSLGRGIFFFPSIAATSYVVEGDHPLAFANRVFIDRQDRVWLGFDGSIYATLGADGLQTFSMQYGQGGRGRTNDIFEDIEGNVFMILDHAIAIVEPSGRHLQLDIGAKAGIQSRDGNYYLSHGYVSDTVGRSTAETFEKDYARARADAFTVVYKRTICFEETQQGSVLLGTLVGLWEWDGHTARQHPAVPDYSISDILQTQEGIVWISSLAQGVGYLYEDRFVPVTSADGLANDICHGLALDAHGVVFVATNEGISRIEVQDYARKQLVIRNFGKNFGLASDEVRSVAVRNGKIYAATASGLSVLQEDFLTATPPRVPVHIQSFEVDGAAVAVGNRPIVLDHRQNRLSIAFAGISFRNADKLQFDYRLSSKYDEGEWIPTASRQLEFPDLRPGNYTLSIRATIDGLPETMGATEVAFEVLPALWETTWFALAVVLVLLVLMLLAFLMALRRLRQQERRRAEISRRIAASEQKALRSQMNPHFIFNSLNSIEKFFITNRPQEANAFIADFSDLIRSILDLSGKAAISLREEMRFIELFLTLESHRMDHRFTFAIEIDPALSPDDLMVPPMIVQPFAENAVWHGISPLDHGDGRINLNVIGTAHGFQIVITDNGIGRQRSEELKSKYRPKHKSSGVRITMERLELLNLDLRESERFTIAIEDLRAPDGAAAGTRIEIFIPHAFNKAES